MTDGTSRSRLTGAIQWHPRAVRVPPDATDRAARTVACKHADVAGRVDRVGALDGDVLGLHLRQGVGCRYVDDFAVAENPRADLIFGEHTRQPALGDDSGSVVAFGLRFADDLLQ